MAFSASLSALTNGKASTAEQLRPGDPSELGSRCTDDGVLFSVHSAAAETLELCLFDADGEVEIERQRAWTCRCARSV